MIRKSYLKGVVSESYWISFQDVRGLYKLLQMKEMNFHMDNIL